MVRFSYAGRKKIVAFACFISAGCAWIVDVPEPIGEDAGAGARSGDAMASNGGTSGPDAMSGSDGMSSGGVVSSNGGNGGQGMADAASPGNCVAICDCDGDTYVAEGTTCGGNDCDDDDDRVHPDQMRYYGAPDLPSRAVGWDFDCSRIIEKKPELDVTAPSCVLGLGDLCPTTTYGYIGPPPGCGGTGKWARCEVNGALCEQYIEIESYAMLCH